MTPTSTSGVFLHGIGPDDPEREPPTVTDDALRSAPKDHADVVMTEPKGRDLASSGARIERNPALHRGNARQ
jgi:hypothetical protein